MSFLLDELVRKNLITQDQASLVENEVTTSNKKEEDVLVAQKFIEEDKLFSTKAEIFGFNFRKVDPKKLELQNLEILPEDTARFYQVIVLGQRQQDGVVEIGMVYPEDLKAQEALRFLSREKNFQYEISLITATDFVTALGKYQAAKQDVNKALGALETEIKAETKAAQRSTQEIEQMAEEAPVARVVAVILRNAVEGKASDIHIEGIGDRVRVRFRQDGILHSSLFLPKESHPAVVARIKILSNLKIDESRMPQDGRFALRFGEKNIDFRVSTFPTANGESVCLRVLDPEEGLKKLEDLGIEGHNYDMIVEAIEKPYGMILVTGPTGSGKTTTLYSVLRKIISEEINIMTLEDPIEYVIPEINQSQTKPEIGYTFASGLRSMMRHDPDVIMVGEIRDHETSDLAVHSALTGHIVLSTLHTNDSIGAIPRFVNLGIPSFLIPPSLNLVIAQRLVRHVCPDCAERYEPGEDAKKMIKKELGSLPDKVIASYKLDCTIEKPLLWRAKGCAKCNNTGYIGRRGIYEMLTMTDSLAHLIATDLSESKIKEEAQKQGMVFLRQDGLLKAMKGITTLEEIMTSTKESIDQ